MSIITVDKEKCIRCGRCVEECPTRVITMGKEVPEEVENPNCIACGHCTAVCPTEAIDNAKVPLSGQTELGNYIRLDEKQAELFLRSRRSIRKYLKKEVSREDLTKLVNIARLAPTGANSQGISFVVVRDKQLLERTVALCVEMIENSPSRDAFKDAIDEYKQNGNDPVLRGAPSLVLAVADDDLSWGRGNAISCLTYMELFAPSLGLGSCWAGGLEMCCNAESSPLPKLFGIPEGKKIVGAVMVGYPKNKFKRLVERNALEVSFID